MVGFTDDWQRNYEGEEEELSRREEEDWQENYRGEELMDDEEEEALRSAEERNKEEIKKRNEEEGVLLGLSSLQSMKARLELILFLREKEREKEDDRMREEETERKGLNLSSNDLELVKKGLQLGEISQILKFIREQEKTLNGKKELLLCLVEASSQEEDEEDAKTLLKTAEFLLKDGDSKERIREIGEYVLNAKKQPLVVEWIENHLKRIDEVGYLKILCKFNQHEVIK
jgi:hypothetical protein